MSKKFNVIKLTSGILAGTVAVAASPVLFSEVTQAASLEPASPVDKGRLSEVAIAPGKLTDFKLAEQSIAEEYSSIRKTALELIRSETVTKEEIEQKIAQVEEVKARLLKSISAAKGEATEELAPTSPLATPEDKARLSEAAPSPRNIADYSLADTKIAAEYSAVRKTALELVRSDTVTKEEIEKKIAQVEEVKARLLKSIAVTKGEVVEEATALDKITLKFVKNGLPFQTSVRLMKWDGNIPNIVATKNTAENGEVEFSSFAPSSKYEIRVADTKNKYDRDVVLINTDAKGKIISIDGQNVTKDQGPIVFTAHDKQSSELKTVKAEFTVINKETGQAIQGVNFTANTITPNLASYKTVTSDQDGKIIFDLEGQEGGKKYTICLAKNDQFSWDFEPSEITITVDENGVDYGSSNRQFAVVKNDRNNLKSDLSMKIEEAERLIKDREETPEIKELKKVIAGSKEELAKSETIPQYVQGFIASLIEKMEKITPEIVREQLTIPAIFVMHDNKIAEDGIQFVIASKENPAEIIAISTENSMLMNIVVEKGVEYTLKLQENDNYSLEPITFVVNNEEEGPKVVGSGTTLDTILLNKKEAPTTSEIYRFRTDNFKLDAENNIVTVEVFGKDLTDDIKILVKEVNENGEVPSGDVTKIHVAGTEKKKTVTLNVDNNSVEEKTYKVYFYYGSTEKETEHVVTITKAPAVTASKETVITAISSMSNGRDISAENAIAYIDVVGTNLNKEDISFEILKNDEVVTDVTYTLNVNSATAEKLVYTLEFPNNETAEKVVYTAKVKNKGTLVDNIAPLTFNMKAKVSENDVVVGDLSPISATLSENRKKITVTFAEEIKAAANLYDNISIATGVRGDAKIIKFENLGNMDIARINGKQIDILLNTPLKEDAPYYRLKIKEKTLKNASDVNNKEFISLLEKESVAAKPQITDYIIKNPVLTSKGGVVDVEIIGENLKPSEVETRIRVTDVTKHAISNEITKGITYREENGKLIATITLPENTTDVTQSYSLTFYNYLEQMFKKTPRSNIGVISVLPEGKTEKDITISNLTVSSYAATESADGKHTVAARNQESKKTYVRIYGTNLDTDLTKVRVFDENGVEWPIRSAINQVDGTTVMMVTLNVRGEGTGIEGEGNFQLLEVILPNNLTEDMTFTYYVSVDGSGEINKENSVTATVEATSASSSKVEAAKRTVTVKYVDETGKKIKDRTEKVGYSWFTYNVDPEEIDGYIFTGVKDGTALISNFGDTDKEIVLLYKKDSKVEIDIPKEAPKEEKSDNNKVILEGRTGETTIKVIFDASAGIDKNHSINIIPLKDTTIIEKVQEQLQDDNYKVEIYDIFVSKGEDTISNSKERTVIIAVAENTNEVLVYHVNEETGKLELIQSELKNGNVIFKINHFSKFVIATKATTNLNKDNNVKALDIKKGNKEGTSEKKEKILPKTGIVNTTATLGLSTVLILSALYLRRKFSK